MSKNMKVYFYILLDKMKKNPWIADKLEQLISDIDSKKITDEKYIKESLERFKHERLIHIIVTIFMWLFFVILFVNTKNSIILLVLDIIILILECFYLRHYYRLENWVQKLNQQYLKILWNKKTK